MSSKHLQRLRATQQHNDAATSSGSESEEDQAAPKLRFNPFSLIEGDDGGADAAASDEASASEPESPPAAEPKPPPQQQPVAARQKPSGGGKQAPAGSRKAKQKGGRGGGGKQRQQDEEDIDELLKQMGAKPALPAAAAVDSAGKPAPAPAQQSRPLLGVNPKQLKGDDELRRIFGASVVAADARNDAQRGRRAVGRAAMKRGLLVNPKPHWPPFLGGQSMEVVGTTDDGAQLLAFVHSGHYTAAQMIFEDCQASHDPNNIVALLQQTPYHTDSLLVMFNLYRSTGEHSTAQDTLERALYAFEMAWHHAFNPSTANVRLDFDHEANKGFFEALFRYVQGLSRRGLHGTALEVAKLLLALDSRDPMGMLFYVDFLAACTRDAEFVGRCIREWDDGSASLLMFPNWSFTNALLGWQLARGAAGPDAAAEQEQADANLGRAAAIFPLAVTRLMKRLNDQGVGRGLEWQAVLGEPPFRDASDGDSATLSHVVDIFVERHHLLWKPQDVQEWLRRMCKQVCSGPDYSGTPLTEWAQVAASAYPPSDTSSFRHLRVEEFGDAVAALPPEEAAAQMQGPPADAMAQLQQQLDQQQLQGGGGAGGGDGRDLDEMSTLEALMRSLMPSFNAGGPLPAEGENGQPPERQG